jgi:hypothetical protein
MKRVLRRCGRFTLLQAEEGFEWELRGRAGGLWYWNPASHLWTGTCRLSPTPEAATLDLNEALAREAASDSNESPRSPIPDESALADL